jgi:hypothetical protein
MKRSWQRLSSVTTPTRAQSVPAPFHLSFRYCRRFSTTFPALSSEAQDEPTRFHWMHNQRSIGWLEAEARVEREAKLNLNVESPHSEDAKIYGEYLTAVNGTADDPLPLEIHQAVLRACTPQRDVVRAHMARLLQEDKLDWHQLTHPYESRFQQIIQNISSAGFNPSIKDYHFIMSQLAAVGHHVGIRKYMRHMDGIGLEPNQVTFGYLLQAIAHQISLSVPSPERPDMVRKLAGTVVEVVREMVDLRIPPSSANLDLAFRVLSEVHDLQGVAEVLRLGYGMDLSYLDSPPIDTDPVPSTPTAEWLPQALPFSTSALNSILETLGHSGKISKMMYVFETLTNPLPVPAKPDNTFDDDDDDFFPIQQVWKPPSAEPNTTSFNTLIKHCAAHRYPWLAKHYATQLTHEEHKSTLRLRNELRKKPLSEVAAPRVAVSAETLRPIQGFANRDHDIKLLKWIIWACKVSVRRKYRSWTYYDQTKSKYDPPLVPPSLDPPDSSESPPSPSTSLPSPSRKKYSSTFNVTTHLHILKQDIARLLQLRWTAEDRLFESIARSKARMGRRIWDEKNIYLEDEGGRVKVDPEDWKVKVNFMESKKVVVPRPKARKYLGKRFNPTIAATRSQRS